MFGSIHYQTGFYVAAQHDYQEALNIARTIGWRLAEAFILGNLGNNYFDMGDYPQSEHYHLQALAICRETGNRLREAMSLDTLGLVYYAFGRGEEAQAHYQQALAIQRDMGARRDEAYTLHHLGLALENIKDYEQAHQIFTAARRIRQELDQTALTMDDLAGSARVAAAMGKGEVARAYVEEILTWLADHSPDGIEFPVLVYLSCYQVLAATSAGPEDIRRAREVLEAGYRLLQQRAGQIQDEVIRRQFLEQVPFNRALLEAWEAHGCLRGQEAVEI